MAWSQGSGSGATDGNHFTSPWLLAPVTALATGMAVYDASNTVRDGSTAAFFTDMATRGLQDQTNWTANTYKTLLSVASGDGLIAGLVGPTAGGAETTTYELTIDGVLTTITITNASGERASLLNSWALQPTVYTTANAFLFNRAALAASATTFQDISGGGYYLNTWNDIQQRGVPCLRFNSSLLIRAKHSASITNSTATAYSAVMYRAGISS